MRTNRRDSGRLDWRTAAAIAALGAFTAMPAYAQETIRGSPDEPPPTSAKEDPGPIDKTFSVPKPSQTVIFPEFRNELRDLPAFIRDSKMEVQVRSFYFD